MGSTVQDVIIPERFSYAINQHLVFNYTGVQAWPLVLGIFGRPGDGKSFQVRTHLERRGILPVSINAHSAVANRSLGVPIETRLAHWKNFLETARCTECLVG